MSTRPDSRKHPRFEVEINATVLVGGQSMVATTKDMSHGGICLICPQRVKPGAHIALSLALALGANAFSENLEMNGRVVWCTPLGQTYQVGVVFTDAASDKKGHLDMFLRFLQQEILLTSNETAAPEKPALPFDTGDPDKT